MARVLKDEMSGHYLHIEDLDTLPAIFRTCRQLRLDATYIWSGLNLRSLTPLPPFAGISEERKRHGLEVIYGGYVPNLQVEVPVVYAFAEDSFQKFVDAFIDQLGYNPAREILYVEDPWGYVEAMDMWSGPALLDYLAPAPSIADAAGFVATIAPTNHANIFGWMQYAKLNLNCLTIRVTGLDDWDMLDFGEKFFRYCALPLIILMASIIAYKPRSIRKIVLTKLGVYKKAADYLWKTIPSRTPLTDQNHILDQLVGWPFEGGLENIGRMHEGMDGMFTRVSREGNLLGLRSVMEWQSLILKAWHGRFEAAWEFQS